jgi:hypothetical protein
MPGSLTLDLKTEDRDRRQDMLAAWARGAGALPLDAEIDSDFSSFPIISGNAEAAIAALDTETERDKALARVKATYALALLRDMKYNIAGRRFLFELGLHNALRELYSGSMVIWNAENC